MASRKESAAKGGGLTLQDAVCMVVEQGLSPQQALLLCNHGDGKKVRSDALSRAISQAVKERADKEINAFRAASGRDGDDEEKDDAVAVDADGSSAQTPKEGHSDDDNAGAAGLMALAGSLRSASTSTAGQKRKSPSPPTFTLKPTFSAPYLKGGLTHFQRKVQAAVRKSLEEGCISPSPEQVKKKAKKIVTRKTTHQLNVHWQNEKSRTEDVNTRYSKAFKECTQKIADLRSKKIPPPPSKGQQWFVDEANAKYKLSGEGKENSREQKKVTLRTAVRAVDDGRVGMSPLKKGREQQLPRDLLRLVAVHANMEQVGTRGELDSSEIKATLMASVMNTVHDGDFNLEYAWEQCRRENPDILVPTGIVQAEDIRWKWVTYEKLNQYFTDLKAIYLKYGFAFDRPETLPDGTIAEITMNPLLRSRNIMFDETEIRLGNDRDKGGPRSKTHTNPLLNRGGARSTRSCTHITGGLAVTAAGEALPPLIIFSSTAKNEENMAVNDAWIEGFGYTRGKYGHRDHIQRLPYIAVRLTGSMDVILFQQYVENATFDLYPEETVSLEIKVNEHGQLVCGPVMWGCDTGPGRISANTDDAQWDEWAKRMLQRGIIMIGLLPNSTTVSAIMDELFRAFKGSIRKATQKVFARKIKDNAAQVAALKKDIAERLEKGETVCPKEKSKVNVVASLNPMDLGEIFFGKLTRDRFPSPTSPWMENFTVEKILQAWRKLGFDPFTRKLLENPKVRHEIGQGEETEQTTMMRNLATEYEKLKDRCHAQGFDVSVFDAELASTSCLIRGETAEERAQDLAKSGKTASAGGMYRFLGNMMYNGEEMLRAREIERENRAQARKEKADEQSAEASARYKAAFDVYEEYVERGSKLDNLVRDECYTLIKFVVHEEGKVGENGKKEAPSHFKSVGAMRERLNQCDPAWTAYFDGHLGAGSDSGRPVTSTATTDSATATTALEEAIESAARSAEGVVDPVCLQRAVDAGFSATFVRDKAKMHLENVSRLNTDAA